MVVSLCPSCDQPVAPQTGSGRPRIFCSAACRRAMDRMRRQLVELEEQLADARSKEWGFWPGRNYWLVEVHRLELAIEQARQQIPE